MLDAITVVEFADYSTWDVEKVCTYPRTAEGEKEARETFGAWVQDNSDDDLSEQALDALFRGKVYDFDKKGRVAVLRTREKA